MISKQVYSIAILVGSIIGAGFFVMPAIANQTGIWIMAFYLVFVGLLVTIIHLMMAEISLKSPDKKRLPGFAKLYFGKKGEKIALFSNIFGLIGSILAFVILGGKFLSLLTGFDVFSATIVYFALGALVIFFGIRVASKIELYSVFLFFIFLALIFFNSLGAIDLSNLNLITNADLFFLPYGVVLFSFWGISMVPEAEELLGKEKKSLKRVVKISFLITFLIYAFFVFLVLSVCGSSVTEASLDSLGTFLGRDVQILAIIFGLLTTFTSFITTGLTFQKVLWFDLGIKKVFANVLACAIPISLFLLGINSFMGVISFVGALFFGVDGLLIILIYAKIRKEKRFLAYPFVLLFIGGALYEIINFIK